MFLHHPYHSGLNRFEEIEQGKCKQLKGWTHPSSGLHRHLQKWSSSSLASNLFTFITAAALKQGPWVNGTKTRSS